MDPAQIKSFVGALCHDFDTILYLQDYDRDKETVLIVNLICERLDSFEKKAQEESYDLKGLFDHGFWESPLTPSVTMGQMRDRIKQLADQWRHIDPQDLENMGYQRFVQVLRSWVYKNIRQLRNRAKLSSQKMIEPVLAVLMLLAVAMVTAPMIFAKVSYNWGLSRDLYEGADFEEHLSVGHVRSIDVKGHSEPFSARWQAFLMVPRDGDYTLFVKVGGGVRLSIDGQVLIDQWQDNKSMEFSRNIFLSKGEHWLCLEYGHHSGHGLLQLYWAFGHRHKTIIPPWSFRSRRALFTNLGGHRVKILRFKPQDVDSGTGRIWALGRPFDWPYQNYLVADNPQGLVSVVKNFKIQQQGRYLVTVFHASAPDEVEAQVKISCISPVEAMMQTWSPHPILGQDSYVCEFSTGKNSIRIFGKGSGPRHLLGVNSAALKLYDIQ